MNISCDFFQYKHSLTIKEVSKIAFTSTKMKAYEEDREINAFNSSRIWLRVYDTCKMLDTTFQVMMYKLLCIEL